MIKFWFGLLFFNLAIGFLALFSLLGSHTIGFELLTSVQCLVWFILLKMSKHEEIANFLKSRITMFHTDSVIRLMWFCCFWGPLMAIVLVLPAAFSSSKPEQSLEQLQINIWYDNQIYQLSCRVLEQINDLESLDAKQAYFDEMAAEGNEAAELYAASYFYSDNLQTNQLLIDTLAKMTQQPLAETYKPNSPRKTKKALRKQMQQWVESRKDKTETTPAPD